MNTPELHGPASKAIEIEHVPDGTGFSGTAGQVEVPDDKPAPDTTKKEQPQFDPEFPFGRPENINWNEIDAAGHELLKEINLRPWIKTTEYCSGHPLDRPADEPSKLYPYVTGENVYEEIAHLDLAYVRGLINDTFFKHRKKELREAGATRFYLNVNVYDNAIFAEWIKLLVVMVTSTMNSVLYPLIIRDNPLRPGRNVSLAWDYWTMEERNMIHDLMMTSLNQFPV